jgi:hypothetical protein
MQMRLRHEASRSDLAFEFFDDRELMNRTLCHERALARGVLARTPEWLNRETVVGPQVYDTLVSVGVVHGSPLRGIFLATGAFLRRCMVVTFETELAPGDPETLLAEKLAYARSIFESVSLDAMRTGATSSEDAVPRQSPRQSP